MQYKRLILLAILIVAGRAHAVTYEWPSSVSCNGTLQACIDAATPGSTIRIVTEAQISAGTYTIGKSLTLQARGTHADFAPGTTIRLHAFSAGNNADITLRNVGIEDGQIQVRFGGSLSSASQTVRLDQVRLDRTADGPSLYVLNVAGALGNAHFALENSDISHHGPNDYGGLELNFDGDSHWQVDVMNNRFRMNPDQSAISNTYGGIPAAVYFVISGNRIGTWQPVDRSSGDTAGIRIVAGDSGTSSTETVSAQIDHNDIYGYRTGVELDSLSRNVYAGIINNTIAYGDTAIRLEKSAGAMGGRIANNVLAFNRVCGLDHGASAVAASNDYNLFYGRQDDTCNGASIGAHAVHGNPRFSGYDFRLSMASPAIDAGNYADAIKTLADGAVVAAPDYDLGTGSAFGTVDMGAHEATFDQSFEHVSDATNVSADYTLVNKTPVGLLASDPLQISTMHPDYTAPLPANAARNLGTWFNTDAGSWTIFNENLAAMPENQHHLVLLDVDTDRSIRARASSPVFNYFALSDPDLDGNPDATPIVTQIFAPDGSGGVYNDAGIGVWYSGGTWYVFNQKPSGASAPSMPDGASFNVLMPSEISRRTHAYRTPSLAVDVTSFSLDHPLLNNIGCAHPFVTASYNPNNVYVPGPLVLFYNSVYGTFRGNWFIRRGDGGTIPAGAAFDVFVDARQSRRCTEDLIWRGGFD